MVPVLRRPTVAALLAGLLILLVTPQVRRIIDDVGYYLQQTFKATRHATHEFAEINAREAVSLLQHGGAKGYFRQEDIEPVIIRISQYLPGGRA